MSHAKHDGHLGAVYDAGSVTDLAKLYDAWAETYDTQMATNGYRHPSVCLGLMARHLPRGAGPILDAGAGTGIIGSWLGILGYPRVEALDVSEGMLAIARRKGAYAAVHVAALGRPLPFATGAYAGIVSAGVFTSGHVGTEGLDELVRVTRAGGVIVLTVKTGLWSGGFEARLIVLEQAGVLTRLEQTAPYVSMPGEPGTVPSLALALRRL